MGSRTNKNYYLIMNPGSQGGRSQKLFREIHRELTRRGMQYRFAKTSSLKDAELLSRQAAAAGYDVIVAVGGDGTINRVINGFYDASGALISNVRLGVIYTGTSPDFCKNYGIPVRNVKRSVQVLAKGDTRTIGIGRMCFKDHSFRAFACCANIGLGAGLAQAANSGIRKRLGDKPGTFLSLIRILVGYRPAGLRINGKEVPHVYNLSVGKTRYIASGLKISHRLSAAADDFYVLCVCNRPLWHIIRLYTGGALPLKYCKRVEIRGNAGVEFDGDPYGGLPVVITKAPPIEVIYERT